MKQITSISDDAKQSMNVVLDDGTKVSLTLEFVSSQKGWFMSLVYGSILTINNRRIVASPNFLRAFRNMIPFGMSCITTDQGEPIYKNDFSTGRANLYVLNTDDVAYVEETVIPGYHG